MRILIVDDNDSLACSIPVQPKDITMHVMDGGQTSWSITSEFRKRLTETIAYILYPVPMPISVREAEEPVAACRVIPFKPAK
jgi:hypothetical protein